MFYDTDRKGDMVLAYCSLAHIYTLPDGEVTPDLVLTPDPSSQLILTPISVLHWNYLGLAFKECMVLHSKSIQIQASIQTI